MPSQDEASPRDTVPAVPIWLPSTRTPALNVTLRPVTVDDAELVHSWRTEPSTSIHQPVLPLSLPRVRAMLAARSSCTITPSATGKFQWIVQQGDEPAGWITLTIEPDQRRHGVGVIGYTIGEAFRGRGIASAALAALLPIAFGAAGFNLERLEAIAAVENIASRRVLERNGFRHEGTLRALLVIGDVRIDHAAYGLLRSEWEHK